MKNHKDAIVIREQKIRAWEEILSATRSLKKALENGEEADVIRLIQRRDDLIKVIDELAHRMVCPLNATFGDERSALAGSTEKTSEILSERLRQIISVNQECETIASAACENIRKELTGINRKEEGLQGYHPRHQSPKFLNIHT